LALGALAAVLVGGSAVTLAVRGGDCPPAGAALAVSGRKVTVAELERRVEVLKALYGLSPPPGSDKAKSDSFPRDLAKSMAVALMIDGDVADRELHVADKTARDALDRYVAEAFPEGGRARFVEALGNQGVSEADVLAEFRRLLETRRLFDAVTGDVRVSDAEVEAAFAERKDRLAVAERRHLRHLVVATEADAAAALARIRNGAAFATVAGEVSLDAATRAAGGDLGPLSAAELAPAFAQAAFAAAPGALFGPVQTDLGWHVGVVEQVTPGRPVTLDEVREPLRQQIIGERRLGRWRKYLGERIAESDACYAARFRPADPDAPPPDITGDPGVTGGTGITGGRSSVPSSVPGG
ncbi:MAG: peptidyl-prolyl cis-trans isomerase, partial [Actinomycetota bacterium]|nr:peptidyl-prolyl cis-trans isomerase [Actinomycetota bacterium]